MAENPMNPKEGLFRMATNPNPSEAPPEAPRPPIRLVPSVEPPPKKRGLGKKARIALAGLATLGVVETAGAVYTEQTNNLPVDALTLIQDVAWPKTLLENTLLKEKALSFFDPTANRSIIEVGINTVTVSDEDLKKAYREQVEKNKQGPTILFPVKFTENGQRVNYEHSKQEQFLVGKDSQTGEPVYMERPSTIHAHFDVGEEIPVPAENAEVFQFPPRVIDGIRHFVGLWIKFQQNGETFAFGISGQDVRTFIPLGEAANAPIVPTNEGGTLLLSEARNGLKLPLGTPVARVNIDTNLNSGFSLSRYNPNNPHVNARWESVKPNFVTDNSTGQTRLMLPQ